MHYYYYFFFKLSIIKSEYRDLIRKDATKKLDSIFETRWRVDVSLPEDLLIFISKKLTLSASETLSFAACLLNSQNKSLVFGAKKLFKYKLMEIKNYGGLSNINEIPEDIRINLLKYLQSDEVCIFYFFFSNFFNILFFLLGS